MGYEQNFLALGKKIPTVEPSVPPGLSFILSRQVGNLLMLSGYGPFWGATVPKKFIGKVGADLTVKQGAAAAELTGINLLLMARQVVQTLDNVIQIVEINGMVNCKPDFTNQPEVINGCSDLMVAVFGDNGRHIRSAVGMSSLAMGLSVEISMSLLIRT